MNPDKEFTGKVILITGASSGLGAAAAVHFSKLGASLSLTGRKTANLQKVGRQCTHPNQPAPLLITADLTSEDDVRRIVSTTIKHFGQLNVLVNNAGIFESGSIETASLDQFDRIFNTNIRGTYQLTGLAVPHLIATRGNIINVSSVAGLRSSPGILVASMGKATLDQFMRCVALELAPKQVRVNNVNPGVTVTECFARGGMSEAQVEAFYERSKTLHPLGRVGQPEEVAEAIAFLASERAAFVTAATFSIDGGRHALCPR